MSAMTCRKCGATLAECRGWLERMNEKGVAGIWECRPSCAERITQEEAVLGAIKAVGSPILGKSAAPSPPAAAQGVQHFVVKHYSDEERPIIKGNGFDGLEIGKNREDAEDFVAWVNTHLAPPAPAEAEQLAELVNAIGRGCTAAHGLIGRFTSMNSKGHSMLTTRWRTCMPRPSRLASRRTPMTAESKTPFTDARTFEILSSLQSGMEKVVHAHWARELEEKLAATQAEVASLRRELEEARKALTPGEPPAGLVPYGHWLEKTRAHAEYWKDGAKRESTRETALICLHQGYNSWMNAAYAMAEKRMAAEQDAAALREELKAMTSARDAHKEAYKLLRKNMEEALADAKGIQLGELCPNCDCRLPVGCGRTFADEPECLLHKP